MVFPSLFCKRAAPLDGSAHESLTRAASLCSESAANDKQETIKKEDGRDEKKTTYPCRSGKPTVLVVPHIKLPPSQILTHRCKQDLMRAGSGKRCDLCLPAVNSVRLQRETYIIALVYVEGSTREGLVHCTHHVPNTSEWARHEHVPSTC